MKPLACNERGSTGAMLFYNIRPCAAGPDNGGTTPMAHELAMASRRAAVAPAPACRTPRNGPRARPPATPARFPGRYTATGARSTAPRRRGRLEVGGPCPGRTPREALPALRCSTPQDAGERSRCTSYLAPVLRIPKSSKSWCRRAFHPVSNPHLPVPNARVAAPNPRLSHALRSISNALPALSIPSVSSVGIVVRHPGSRRNPGAGRRLAQGPPTDSDNIIG